MRIRDQRLTARQTALAFFLACLGSSMAVADDVSEWERERRYVQILSVDRTLQDAFYWLPESVTGPVPLAVGLHTWSGGYKQDQGAAYYVECKKRGWAFIHPDFRGPNKRPEACGSELALQDIHSAVEWAKGKTSIDPDRIYAVGVSGGGHATLMAVARWPEIWAAASAWVPTADLAVWYRDVKSSGHHYWQDLDAVFGGPPGKSEEIDRNYRERSPVYRLAKAGGIPIEISAGIHDGHKGSVPVSHTLRTFNTLAIANGRPQAVLPDRLLAEIDETEAIPKKLSAENAADATYSKKVLFRRQAGPVRVTIFEGGHEILAPAAFAWLEQFKRE